MAVNMEEANQLRARIAALVSQGLEPNEISAQTGCALSTVYKVLRAPGPDRRVLRRAPGNRTGAGTIAAITTLASADPGRSAATIRAMLAREQALVAADEAETPGGEAGPVPSRSTIGRHMRSGRADGTIAPRARRAGAALALRVYAVPGWDAYSLASSVEPTSLAGEIAVLRAMLIEDLARVRDDQLTLPDRPQVKSHALGVIAALIAAVKALPRGSADVPGVIEEIVRLGAEKTGWVAPTPSDG